MFEFTPRLGIGFAKAAEGLVDLGRRPGSCGGVLVEGLATVLTDFFAVRALPGFAAGRLAAAALDLAKVLAADLAAGLRMIFGMMRVY